MTKSPRRLHASKLNFRLFVIIAACVLVASATAATAYMQRQKATATPVVERPSVETQSEPQGRKPAETSKVNTPLVGAEARPSFAQPELDAAALSAQAAALANRELALRPASRRTSPPSINAPVVCSGAGGPWSSSATWGGTVPTAADGVTITNGCTVTIDTAAVAQSVNVQTGGTLQFEPATARTLTVGQSVTIDSGGTFQSATTGAVTTHVLSVGADLTNNGTLDFSTNANTAGADITFTGAGSNTFGGTGATTDIRTLTVNKGTSFANTLELNPSNLTVQGTTTDGAQMAFLTLTNGTLKVSGTFALTARVFTAAAYAIPATAGFWLNNPNFTVAGQNGSPTNNGLLRISSGTYTVGTASGNSMGGGALAVFIVEGGTLNTTGRLQTASAVTYTQTGGTVNVSTVGNASSSSGSFGFSSASSLINMSGGTINLVQASTAVTPIDYQFSGTANITGGTLNVGTAATATNFTFRIQGQIPAVVINNTTNNKTANLSAQGNCWGDLTINPATTLNLNGQTLLMIGQTLTNNGAIVVTTTNTGTVNFAGGLGTGAAQVYQGTGTFGAAALRVASVALQNVSGVTLASGVSALNVYRVNAFFGQFTNSSQISIGAGDATTLVIQRGATGIAVNAGSLDTSPAFNVGSGGLVLVYSQSASTVTTGAEVPASRSILSIQILNPTGVTLAGGGLSASGTTAGLNGLLLNSGTLTTSAANLLTLTGTATTAVSGGSVATYVNGPLARLLPASLASGSTYTFPVGKGSFKMFELVNPTTNAGGTVTVQAEVFDADSGGTPGAGFSAINHNRYWSASITSGAGNFTNTTVRLTEQGTPSVNAIGQSSTQGGAYNNIGGAVAAPTIGPSTTTITSLGFFAVGTLSGAQTISGNFNVGAGGDFATLTAAVAALNSRLMNGPVTFTLTDNVYGSETYPITINPNGGASATNTLIIKPAATRTPSFTGSSATALLFLNGTDYVTIDGSNTVGGTTRNMTFANTNTGTSSAVIWGQTVGTSDSATNNTIKNLNVNGNAPATTLVGIGFGSSTIASTSVGTRNDNNRVQNNLVTAAQFGVYTQGAASANKNFGTVITGNTIGGAGASAIGRAGIFAGFEDGAQITNNNVANVNGASANVDAFGIALGSISVSATAFTTNDDVANATITGNTIGTVKKTDTFSAMGISVATPNYGTTRIANNFVYGVVGNGTSGDFCAGIYAGANTASTMQVYFNSVSMTGARDDATGGNASQPSFALAVLGANPALDVRDNALYNTQTATNGGAAGAAGSYAVGLSSVTFSNITSNYNDLFTSGASSHFAIAGGLLLTNNFVGEQTTLASWQSTTGKDLNSLSVDPLFTSATDPHLQTGSTLINAATPIAAITTDIDGDPRGTVPDIGADEIFIPGSVQLSSTTYNVSEGAGNLVVNVTRTGGSSGAASVHFFTSDGTAGSLDYTAQSGTLNWADGDAANKTITIPINDDGLYEGNELFNIGLDLASGASLGSPSSALITINDNDSPPSFSIDDVSHNEGNSGTTTYTFTVTKTGGTALSSSVDFVTLNNTATTADNDYQFNTGTLNFGPADTSMPVTVLVNGDTTNEPDETFTVRLSNASNATISDTDGTGTIKNDDSATPDYTVTTTGGAIVVTDVSGNGDTLIVAEPAAGQIKFVAAGRNFSVDGGPVISGDSGNLSLSGINSVTVNQGGGNDTLSMQPFTASLPNLTINGDAGDDMVNFNGSITFNANASLNVNLQDDTATPGVDSAFVASGVQLITSGTGTIDVRVSKTVIVGGLMQTQNGDLNVEANRQATPTSGLFVGVGSAGGTIKTTGSGNVNIKGTGGAGDFAANVGVQLVTGAQVLTTGTGAINIDGVGGAGAGGATAGSENGGVDIANLGTLVQSASGAIQITGTGGATNDTGSYGVVVEGGKVQTSGAGTLTITGNGGVVTGGNPAPVDSAGIFVVADDNGDGGVVTSTGTGANAGAIVMTGTAANGGAGAAQGLRVDVPGTVTSVDGNITFNGTGAACGNACLGTSIRGAVTATGAGSINITGTGAASTGAFPTHGVNVRSGGAVTTKDGDINVTGTGGNGTDNAGFNLASTGTGTLQTTGTGNINVNADTINIRTTASANINANTHSVTLRQKTNGVAVNLGSVVDSTASTVEISDAELDRVTAANINVGDSNSGAITVSANITRAAATNLTLTSGVNIDIAGGSLASAGGNVSLNPGTNTFPSLSGTDVNAGAGTLTLASAKALNIFINNTTVDTGYTQLNVVGQVNLNNANLSLSGSHTPSVGQTFVVVNNDGADAITGTFNGLPQGATIPNFLGSGLVATVSYTGGSGNDAVLTVNNAAPPAPTLGNYTATSVPLSGDTTITPDAMPANTTRVNVSAAGNFKGTLTASPSTGVVRVTNAHPAGTYTVMVKAFGAGGMTTKTFMLTVQTGTACADVTTFTSAADVSSPSFPDSIAIGDYNGDGKQDVAVLNSGSDNVSIRLGNGDGTFSGTTTVAVGGHPFYIAAGDFNGDGRADFVTTNNNSTNVSLRLGVGDGTFTNGPNVSLTSGPYAIAVGDFNGDGKPDLAVSYLIDLKVAIRLGNGDGTFTAGADVTVGDNPFAIAVGDFNGDGKQDFVTANFITSDASVRLGNGDGTFTNAADIMGLNRPSSVTVGDFNGDGKQDVAISNFDGNNVSVRLGVGDGTFTSAANVTVGGAPNWLAIGDFNRDGKQDLAVANQDDGTVSILFGVGNGTFTSGGTFLVSAGDTNYVAVGDFNNDAQQDFATTNVGPDNMAVRLGACLPAGSLRFSASNYDTPEGDAGSHQVTVTVQRVGGAGGAASVHYATSDGGATAGSDYVSTSGDLSWADGDSSDKTFTVTVNGDTVFEPSETINLTLSAAAGASLGSPSTATITIQNDEIVPSFSIDDVTHAEGNAGTTAYTFTVTKTGAGAASVSYETLDGTATTANNDYQSTSGSLSFASGDVTKTVTVQVNGDTTPEADEDFAVFLENPSNATINKPAGVGTIKNDDDVAAGQLIISEFRLRGPGPSVGNGRDGGGEIEPIRGDGGQSRDGASAGVVGIAPPEVDNSPQANDEFVELYNNTDNPLFVTTTDGSSGWTVVASGGVELFTIPNGTVIPARGHYLGANGGGYSLGAYAAPDVGWVGVEVPDNAGLAVFRTHTPANYTMATRLDAVGSTAEANALYKEGAGYTALAPADIALNLEQSFYRNLCAFAGGVGCTTAGLPKDSNDNAADFLFVDTQGTQTAAGKRLGAPGPENLSSPIQRNNAFGFALLDGTKSSSVAPNRTRDFTPGNPNNAPNGTLTIRRRVTNHTGAPIARLRFRIIELTTYPNPPGVADLRAISAEEADSVSNVGDATTCGAAPTPCTVDVEVTTLETPPAQAQGGGYNSSLNAPTITLNSPLADGQSVNLKFVLGVVQGGTFRIYMNIEALNGEVPPQRPPSGSLRR